MLGTHLLAGVIEENFSGVVCEPQYARWDRGHGIAVIHHTEMLVVHTIFIGNACARLGERILIVGERSRHSKRYQADTLSLRLVDLA